MKDFIEILRNSRNTYFHQFGKRRINRIIAWSGLIAIIWTFADLKSGVFTPILWDDLICVLLGVILERAMPWGKSTLGADSSLTASNKALRKALKESNEMLLRIADELEKRKQT